MTSRNRTTAVKSWPRILLLACAFSVGGCGMLDVERSRGAIQDRLQDDNDERKARLRAKGTLNPQEYEAMALKMGWTTKGAPGLPPPLTTEELEKRVKDAEAPR
jgi:hypothetical protein